jgi:hypothetical protein
MVVIGTHVSHRRTLVATLILDLEDSYARGRQGPHSHPRPIEPLRFWLAGPVMGGIVQSFDSMPELAMVRNSSGYHLFFREQKLPGSRLGRLALSHGKYRLHVTSPFYQTAQMDVDVLDPDIPKMDADSLDLEPVYCYPFPDVRPVRVEGPGGCIDDPEARSPGPTLLRGTLRGADGLGIAGAKVQVPGRSNTYRTDDTGQWVLWFPDHQPTGTVTVRVTMPDTSDVDVLNVCVVRGRETSLHETALRGWIRRSGTGVSGAAVTVAGHPGQATSGPDGVWTYVFPLLQDNETVSVRAVLPDGTELTQSGIGIKSRATILVPTFAFT